MNQRADDLFILETLRHCNEEFPNNIFIYDKLIQDLFDDINRCIKILEDRKEK